MEIFFAFVGVVLVSLFSFMIGFRVGREHTLIVLDEALDEALEELKNMEEHK